MSVMSHGTVVIWLDEHIGDPQYHSHLKAAFASNIDPTNPEPIKLAYQDAINTSFNDLYSLLSHRTGIPCELRTFVDSEACLRCIRHSLNADKRIFLIVSDHIGRTFLPQIVNQCPEAFHSSKGEACIAFYIFVSYIENCLDWIFDYEDYVLVFSHEVDLLWRLVHDIARYYTENGKELLVQGTLDDIHQALIYFKWAEALCLHEKSITTYQDSNFIKTLETLIHLAEDKAEHDMDCVQNSPYSRADMEKSLNSSLFIYHSKEFRDETAQLFSTFHQLTGEQAGLFDNSDKFIAHLQTESGTIKYCYPIVVSADNGDRMKILKELSSIASIHRIYVCKPTGHTSIDFNDRTLLKSFPKVRNIYLVPKLLALEWTAERASTCEKIGEICTENGDSDLGRMYYAKAIELNERVSVFIKNK